MSNTFVTLFIISLLMLVHQNPAVHCWFTVH